MAICHCQFPLPGLLLAAGSLHIPVFPIYHSFSLCFLLLDSPVRGGTKGMLVLFSPSPHRRPSLSLSPPSHSYWPATPQRGHEITLGPWSLLERMIIGNQEFQS